MNYAIELIVNYCLIALDKFFLALGNFSDTVVFIAKIFVILTYIAFWITLILSPFIGIVPVLIFGLLSIVFLTLKES